MCISKKFLVFAAIGAILALLAIQLSSFMAGSTPNSGERQALIKQAITTVDSSYQAMDAAMNASASTANPHIVLAPQQLLLPQQAQVSSSTEGAFLYSYDVYRVSVFRSWAAMHARDYSSIHVWSTFHATAVTINGSQATVKGIETLHIDATVQDNGQRHQFSADKEASQTWLKQAGLFLNFGETNHAQAQVNHTVTLGKSNNSWLIESDNYLDPLAQTLASNHRALLTVSQANASQRRSYELASQGSFATYSYTYYRQQAINYAESWWNSCNPNYTCYESQDVDCANFVSQALYDGSGGDLPGDNSWYAGSYDFVNANALYGYLVNSPYGSTYNYAATSYSSYDYGTAAYDDDWYEYPGDVIFYDWGNVFGFGNADGVIDHVAISVTQDANGYTYEDAHTTNLHHWYWDLGGGNQTGYYFVIMNNSGYSTWPQ